MEEDQEDMNELMKKHKAAVAQVTQPAGEQFESISYTETEVFNAQTEASAGNYDEYPRAQWQ